MKEVRVGILTVGDSVYWGDAEDECSPVLLDWLKQHLAGAQVELEAIVQQRRNVVAGTLLVWADEVELDLIFTLGGAELGFGGVAIEAAQAIAEPLIGVHAAVAGTRHNAMIVNLPGDASGVQEVLNGVSAFLCERWNGGALPG